MTGTLRHTLVAVGLAAMVAATPARAEVDEVVIVQQFGIGYLQITVAKHEKLVEKHAEKAGLKNLKTKWPVLGNAVPINDGLLAGTIHFGSGGTAPMIAVWDKTRNTPIKMQAVSGLSALPLYLVSRNPYKSVKDFKESDRISMAGAGQSIQTLYLQMAVAKEFGIENYKKLNPLFVNLSHPDGLNALLSGAQVTASFLAPPFQYRAVERGMHKVLSSYDVTGGPATFIGLWASGKFRDENPKTFKAVFDAMAEATELINKNKRKAAEIYVKDTGDKEKVEDIEKLLNDPEFVYSMAPMKTFPLAEFMHAAGILKTKPTSWKDYFFPEAHGLPGS